MKKLHKPRITWGFSPVSRVKQSKKIYSRKKFNKADLKKAGHYNFKAMGYFDQDEIT